eukprot:s1516_g12.t1
MHSLVVGASRGLGLALTRHLAEAAHGAGSGGCGGRVLAAARRPVPALEDVRRSFPDIVEILELDVTDSRLGFLGHLGHLYIGIWRQAEDPDSVSSAASRAKELLESPPSGHGGRGGLHLLCHTAGLLQDKDRGVIPENHLQKIEANALAYSFAVSLGYGRAGAADRRTEDSNVPGAKAVFYSARMVRCASIELRRHSVCCFALHPGTVDTDLTRAFARARAKYKVQDVDEAVQKHLQIVESRTMADSGRFFDWQGEEVPNLLGLLGAVQLYLGLVLGQLPFILGVSTDNEGKVAALLENCLILGCWLVERFYLSDAPLPAIQSAICVVSLGRLGMPCLRRVFPCFSRIGLACTIIDWAGPIPYDDMRLGFASQTAGCDGGFRSPFVLYVSAWITGLVFGTLLLFFEDAEGAIFSCGEKRRWTTTGLPIRQKALPVVYGLATSMSCVLFATGSASNDMSWVTAGVLLLVISVVCTWDFLWCLDMNLATYGALFHGTFVCRIKELQDLNPTMRIGNKLLPGKATFGMVLHVGRFATGLRAIQNHAIFRDLRWDPADAHGILVVYQYPGLQIFIVEGGQSLLKDRNSELPRIFLILLHPRFLPAELRRSMQNYVMTLAPMRFTQPSIMMLVVGVASLPMENQHPETCLMPGAGCGYWFFLTYCVTNLILAWSVQPPELPDTHEVAPKKIRRDPLLQLELKKHWHMEDSEEDFDESLQGSKASFAARASGVVIHRVTPTVLDLWYSIGSVNRFLMIVFPFLWLVLLCVRLASKRPGLEPMLRPYVMTARNKNVMEVCASFPSVPIAPVAIVFMGAGTFALIHMAKALHHDPTPPDTASNMQLPIGGKALWMGGPAAQHQLFSTAA